MDNHGGLAKKKNFRHDSFIPKNDDDIIAGEKRLLILPKLGLNLNHGAILKTHRLQLTRIKARSKFRS